MPGYKDWTSEEKALIDGSYRYWLIDKDNRRVAARSKVPSSLAAKLMPRPPPPGTANWEAIMEQRLVAWEARRWPQEIGKYYANRFAAENGRSRAQRKTPEQVALLNKLFRKAGARPYTGEQIAVAFLTGLELKQVKTWFENERKKYLQNDPYGECDFWPQVPPQDPTASRLMVLEYDRDRQAYARQLVYGERDACTGSHLDGSDDESWMTPGFRVAASPLGRASLVRDWEAWEREHARADDEAEAGWEEEDDE